MTSKQQLEDKRDQMRVQKIEGFLMQFPNDSWDQKPSILITEARKLVFAWLITDAEEGLSKA